jgi:hypothetical protein
VLRPADVESQLNDACAIFLKKELVVDPKRRHVILPKIFEVYKGDFGDSSLGCLRFCLGGLDDATASTIRVMMMDESTLVTRYQHTAEMYLSALTLRDDGHQREAVA